MVAQPDIASAPAMRAEAADVRCVFVMVEILLHGLLGVFSNVKTLIPLAVEAGVTGVWIGQIGDTIDYTAIRRDHPHVLLLGGIDSRVLAQDEYAIVGEVMAKVPLLLTKGRYFPALDE